MRNRTGLFAAAAGILIAAVAAHRVRAVPDAPSESQVAFAQATFRLTFGLLDESPRSWDGRVLPVSGQSIHLEPDRLRHHNYSAKKEPDLPNDYIRDSHSWVAGTRGAWMRGPKNKVVIERPSLLLNVLDGAPGQEVRIETIGGNFSFRPSELTLFRAQRFLNGNVQVERVLSSSPIAPQPFGNDQDFPSIFAARSGVLYTAWQEHREDFDQLYVREGDGTVWKAPFRLAADADIFRTAVAEDPAGKVWVIWSQQVKGNWALYGRAKGKSTWSKTERLSEGPGPDIYHRAITDSHGNLWLVWQKTVRGAAQIFAKTFDGRTWSQEFWVSDGVSARGNNWWPAIAAGPNGLVSIVWDGYSAGSYDVFLRQFRNGSWDEARPVVNTARFEACPSVAIDSLGRTWIAWHESGPEWGKDTGALVIRKGSGLYEQRHLRIAVAHNGSLLTTAGLLTSVFDETVSWHLPHLQIDANGQPWLFARRLNMRIPDSRTTGSGSIYSPIWDIYVTRYQDGVWSPLSYVPHSAGRNDMMPATTVDNKGSLWLAWPTDQRSTESVTYHQQGEIRIARVAREPSRNPGVELIPYTDQPPPSFERIHPNETAALKRIRSYRISIRGKTYQIYRGDLHRHTEISWDGGADGSVLDAYRYARDAASLDFLGITDHADPLQEPYNWWLMQKFADLFQVKDFAAFYAVERSLPFPNGHRNLLYPARGVPLLPINPTEERGWEGAGRLYAYLRRYKGIAISHTSGTNAGTDWRDNDPVVEPLVEIYQGLRDTYEYAGAPRPKTLQPSPALSADSPPPQRYGMVWNALAKGYKLGFIASSDHHSTHVSYACLIADGPGRDSLFEAMRARRAYAATDNIIVDLRSSGSDGEHIMGEESVSSTPVHLSVKVFGTAPIKQLDVIKNNKIVYTLSPSQPDVQFQYADADKAPGESYFYVRVMQTDGEMAWSSPIWTTYE